VDVSVWVESKDNVETDIRFMKYEYEMKKLKGKVRLIDVSVSALGVGQFESRSDRLREKKLEDAGGERDIQNERNRVDRFRICASHHVQRIVSP
jgi:hypothetical protein